VTAGRGAADSICRVELPDGCAETFGMESWSPWLPVRFKLGAFHWIRGQLRARVSGETDRPVLYVSPVHPDPSEPPHPISHPWEYAGDIARESGRFHTLGMSEEHQGLNNGRLDEAAYLDQCRTVMAERRALLLEELHRTTHGLVACVFDTPDRLQHMFWRFREEDHPANGALGFDPAWQATVDEHYGECDDVVGEVVGSLSDHDLLLVLSDHGFGTFRRELHLNTILHRAGLLHLREGALPGDGARDLLGNVDWTRTRAYALGLSGVYLNLEGREGEGIVPADEATATAQDVARVLSATRDPENPGDRPLRWVRPRESVYRGAATTHAPDVLVGCAPGYRISSRTAMGGFDGEMFSPNQRGWAGDHVVDPDAVPGILVSGAPIDTTGPDLLDIAPTVLAALGVPEEGSRPGHEPLEGRSLL
jgi:predicted AlkP superfamily phosphohydrolase/phosphomutase